MTAPTEPRLPGGGQPHPNPPRADEKPYLPLPMDRGANLKQIAADTHWSWWVIRKRAGIARRLLGVTGATRNAVDRARELDLLPDDAHLYAAAAA